MLPGRACHRSDHLLYILATLIINTGVAYVSDVTRQTRANVSDSHGLRQFRA